MKRQTINRVTWISLSLGLGGAIVVFLLAEPAVVDPLLGDYRSSKRYRRELKVMGGEANVLADEFQGWFSDQWHGRELARTLVVLTIGSVLLFRLLASHPDYADKNSDEASAEINEQP